MGTKYKDITGQIFNSWKVLNITDKRGADGSVIWQCKCLQCGNIYLRNGSNLRNGHSKMCLTCHNHQQRKGKNIANQKFGMLTALEQTKQTYFGQKIWKCKCDCGNIAYFPIGSLTSGKTQSCGCLVSKGENKIKEILTEAKIPFVQQKKFMDCKDKRCLPFDFYVNSNYLIEFDGEQHFENGRYWGNKDKKEDVLRKDNIKNNYCKQHNIALIRIPYWKIKTLTLKDLQLQTTEYLIKYEYDILILHFQF